MDTHVDQNQSEEPIHQEPSQAKSNAFLLKFLLVLISFGFLGLLIATGIFMSVNQPPAGFPINQPVVIEQGTKVRDITTQLKAEGVVQSEQVLYYLLAFFHDPADIKASTYVFDEPLDMLAVAKRLTEGDFDTDLLRFTHTEGERVTAIANRADALFVNFDAERFIQNALQYEGMLFPETYLVPPTYTDAELLTLFLETFAEKIAPFKPAIASSTFSEKEVLILASILEREANSPESMAMVSGILQNRLEIGMALQADATIEYVIDTPLGELPEGQLASELRELDSPYNSYLYPGLPPTPIGNPGTDAIYATLNPTESDFFYYITGEDGVFYYAKTYDEHRANIAKYLR